MGEGCRPGAGAPAGPGPLQEDAGEMESQETTGRSTSPSLAPHPRPASPGSAPNATTPEPGRSRTPPPDGTGRSRTPPPDGTGRSRTPPPDGTGRSRTPPPDGTGRSRTPPPDGTGRSRTTPPDGTGRSRTPPPDGTGRSRTPPPDRTGRSRTPPPDGTGRSRTTPPDGTGRSRTTPPDGTGRSRTPPPDRTGRSKTPPPDGTGRSRTPPPDGTGRSRTLPPDGTGRSRTPPPDGTGRSRTPPPDGTGRSRTPPPDGTGRSRTPPPDGTGRSRTPPPDGTGRSRTPPPDGTGRSRTPPPDGTGRSRTPPPDGPSAEREEPPAPAAAAAPGDTARVLGAPTHRPAAGMGPPLGWTGRPAFSARSQLRAADPTSVPGSLGTRGTKEPPSPLGSTLLAGSPPGLPGSARGDPGSWAWTPTSALAGRGPGYSSGESALPPGPSDLGPRGANTLGAALTPGSARPETSPGRAADTRLPVTSPPPSAPGPSPALWASAGGRGAQLSAGGGQGAAHKGAAVTPELAGTGAGLPSPTEGSGALRRGQTELTLRTAAAAPREALGTGEVQPEGWESVTGPRGAGSSSTAEPATATAGSPDGSTPGPLTTAARSAPRRQPSTPRVGPLGASGPGEGLEHALEAAGSEESPGLSGVDGAPENLDVSLPNDTRTERTSWAAPLPGASPDRLPGAYAGTPGPLASPSASGLFSALAQPAAPSPGADLAQPGLENGSLPGSAPEPSLPTPAPEWPSRDSRTRAWLPRTPAERTRGPGPGEPRSTVTAAPDMAPSGHVSSLPPGSRAASLPAGTMTSQEGLSPGVSSGEAGPQGPGPLPATSPPPASQPAGADRPAATALSPTEPPAPPGPGPSTPFSLETDSSGAPATRGLSVASTQSPLQEPTNATATTSPVAAAHGGVAAERLSQQAATRPDGAEPGNSSQATDAPAPRGAGGSLPSSSRAQASPTPPTPGLRLTAGSWRPWPTLAATLRAWSRDVPEPVSSARANVSASSQRRAAEPPVTPGPAAVTEEQPLPSTTQPAWDRAQRLFVVEDQPPLLKATLLRVPCELALDVGSVGAWRAQPLVQSFNETVAPLFAAVPGFQRLEVKRIRDGPVVLEYDALFAAARLRGLGALLNETLLVGAARAGLRLANATVLRNVVLAGQLDPCAVLFSCHVGFECVRRGDGDASCTSVCHRDYCKNQGICTHRREQEPVCQCPVGSDYWFMGLRCDYKVTQRSLLGAACGVLLSVALLGAAIAGLVVRRVKTLLLEAQVDQTQSSYRRFCRLDDVSAHYWSESWLASASSLDNPAFSNSEERLHLQMLDTTCCSCRDAPVLTDCHQQHPPPPIRTVCRPSFHYDWDTSSSSINDPMIDSGKASDISVSSWPMEPGQWAPFPILHQLSRQRPPKARRPRSYCEGMELVNLERSWTA
ncbi:uncharacterized protein LOC142818647 isoform X2 [Pelodiscus sinensis]